MRLQPGETVAEAGCGWGALALYIGAALWRSGEGLQYLPQADFPCAAARAGEKLSDLVEFIEDDYRNLTGSFDAFVSVGMLEHAGRENYAEVGAVIHRTIGDRGRGLLHFIGRSQEGQFSRWIRKRIFPGAHVPPLREALQIFEPYGYFVEDVENLRPHYARTLEHWPDRFEKSSAKITAMYDAQFERAWRLYLAGSIAGFRAGTLQLFSGDFLGAKCGNVPWTRADLYRERRENSAWTPATS